MLLDALDKAWDEIDAPKKEVDDAGFKEFTSGMKSEFQTGPPVRTEKLIKRLQEQVYYKSLVSS